MNAARRTTTAALVRELVSRDPETAARLVRMLAEAPQGAIKSPLDAVPHLVPHLAGHETERVAVIAVDRKMRPLDVSVLSAGTDGAAIVDPRTILRWSLTRSRPAYGLILAHNHPSGDPTPSREDREVTRKLAAACEAVGLVLLDHLVVVDSPTLGLRATSLAERGEIPPTHRAAYAFTA